MVDVEPAIQYALAQVGKPYVFGASGPSSFDCSGLIMRAYQKVGINMPHSTYQQITYGVGVAKSQLQRGDLIFPDPGHVQIYLGNGTIVEAPHSGANVRVVPMWGFYAARRLGTASGASNQDIVITPVSNPVDDLKQKVDAILNALKSTESAAKWLANSHNWYRLFLIGLGVVLLVVALRMLVTSETMTLVKKATDAV